MTNQFRGRTYSTRAETRQRIGARRTEGGSTAFKALLALIGITVLIVVISAATNPTGVSLSPSASAKASAPAQTNAPPLEQIVYADTPDPKWFAKNCASVTKLIDQFFGYKASACLARRGVVLVRPTPAAKAHNDEDAFYDMAIGAIGWAVNEGYYSEGTSFVIGAEKAHFGCHLMAGEIAATAQYRIKEEKKDMLVEMAKAMARSKSVVCPEFMS